MPIKIYRQYINLHYNIQWSMGGLLIYFNLILGAFDMKKVLLSLFLCHSAFGAQPVAQAGYVDALKAKVAAVLPQTVKDQSNKLFAVNYPEMLGVGMLSAAIPAAITYGFLERTTYGNKVKSYVSDEKYSTYKWGLFGLSAAIGARRYVAGGRISESAYNKLLLVGVSGFVLSDLIATAWNKYVTTPKEDALVAAVTAPTYKGLKAPMHTETPVAPVKPNKMDDAVKATYYNLQKEYADKLEGYMQEHKLSVVEVNPGRPEATATDLVVSKYYLDLDVYVDAAKKVVEANQALPAVQDASNKKWDAYSADRVKYAELLEAFGTKYKQASLVAKPKAPVLVPNPTDKQKEDHGKALDNYATSFENYIGGLETAAGKVDQTQYINGVKDGSQALKALNVPYTLAIVGATVLATQLANIVG